MTTRDVFYGIVGAQDVSYCRECGCVVREGYEYCYACWDNAYNSDPKEEL